MGTKILVVDDKAILTIGVVDKGTYFQSPDLIINKSVLGIFAVKDIPTLPNDFSCTGYFWNGTGIEKYTELPVNPNLEPAQEMQQP